MKQNSAIAVANWFVLKGISENKPVDTMKLLKLVYIAQGVALAKGHSLFEEPIEAWKYGPVIPSVYHAYKAHGNNPITKLTPIGGQIDFDDQENIVVKPEMPDENKQIDEILTSVWEAFSPYTGVKLSNWSHEEAGPWFKEWEHNNGKTHTNHAINPKLMEDYFRQFIN